MHRENTSPPGLLELNQGLGSEPIVAVDDVEGLLHVVLGLSKEVGEGVAHIVALIDSSSYWTVYNLSPM